jgi:glycosyltransferase involved in cell wall biosynthesis
LSIIKTNKISFLDDVIIFYKNNLIEQKETFGFYNYLIELKSILKRENIFDILFESYKLHAEKISIKNIIQSKYNLYIYEELKKGKFKKLGINEIPSNIINLYADKNKEVIIKNSSYFFNPKISVIIPIYNSKKYLNECLNNILNQTLKEIEIICINDGSTDNSLELIQQIIEKDYRVKIINQINKGVSEARNIGVKYAKGEFLFFLDSDDYLDNNCLYELYYKVNKYNLDILFFEKEDLNDNTNLTKQKNEKSLRKKNTIDKIYKGIDLFIKMEKEKYNISPCLQIIKKEFYKKINFNFIQGILFEGRMLFLTLILQAERTCYINKPYYKYRIYSNSMNKTESNIIQLYSYIIIYSEILKLTEKISLTEESKIYILKDIRNLENNILQIYSNNKNDTLKSILTEKLTIYQNIQFNKIIEFKTLKNLREYLKKNKKRIKLIIGFFFTLLFIYII